MTPWNMLRFSIRYPRSCSLVNLRLCRLGIPAHLTSVVDLTAESSRVTPRQDLTGTHDNVRTTVCRISGEKYVFSFSLDVDALTELGVVGSFSRKY